MTVGIDCMFGGIDVGASRLHCAGVDAEGRVAEIFVATSAEEAASWAAGLSEVAVDAPDQLSTGAHAADEAVSRKFRQARCGEIALGRERGIWVPWPTPAAAPVASWMETGFALFGALRAAGGDPIEVYPAGAFWLLAGRRWPPPKTTAEGRRARAGLLTAAGARAASMESWPHHALDAVMAALVARDRAGGLAVAAGCGHDGSAIWMPALEGG